MKIAKGIDRALRVLDTALQIVAVALLGMVAFAVIWQVLARYVLTTSTPWTSELASYSFVWLSMVAIALGVRRGRHLRLDVWEYLPYRLWIRRLVDTCAAVVVVAVLVLLIWFGLEGLPASFRRMVPGLGIPFGWVMLAVPVGCVLSTIFALDAWWKTFHAKRGEDPLPTSVLYQPDDVVVIKGEL